MIYRRTRPAGSGLTGEYIPEYAGYPAGKQVKQADTVMLRYPIGAPILPAPSPPTTPRYYAAHTDADGPAMTWQIVPRAAANTPDQPGVARACYSRATGPVAAGQFALSDGWLCAT